MNLTDKERDELYNAMKILETPGIAAKITSAIGTPIEKGLALLPKDWNEKIGKVTQSALLKAVDVAVFTMDSAPGSKASNWWHKAAAAASGAAGGFFGFTALAVELPVSTTIMLRSIADIARSEGESVNDPHTKLACLEVFALGGKSESDNAAESGYFAIRGVLARSIAEAAEFVATRQLGKESAPTLVRFITAIAQRFSIPVTQKAAAQAIPAIGAAGGAIVNTIFIDHFQDMAKGHFIVRRLEKIHGKEVIQSLYEEMLKAEKPWK